MNLLMNKLMNLPQITHPASKYQSWDAHSGATKPRQSLRSQLLLCIMSRDGAGLGERTQPWRNP